MATVAEPTLLPPEDDDDGDDEGDNDDNDVALGGGCCGRGKVAAPMYTWILGRPRDEDVAGNTDKIDDVVDVVEVADGDRVL